MCPSSFSCARVLARIIAGLCQERRMRVMIVLRAVSGYNYPGRRPMSRSQMIQQARQKSSRPPTSGFRQSASSTVSSFGDRLFVFVCFQWLKPSASYGDTRNSVVRHPPRPSRGKNGSARSCAGRIVVVEQGMRTSRVTPSRRSYPERKRPPPPPGRYTLRGISTESLHTGPGTPQIRSSDYRA